MQPFFDSSMSKMVIFLSQNGKASVITNYITILVIFIVKSKSIPAENPLFPYALQQY